MPIGQTAAILHHLAPTLKLVGRSEAARVWTQQIQLTIADMVSEAHDTHHPVDSGLHYEDQLPEARRRVAAFCATRIAKYLQWFEAIVVRNSAGSRHLVGGRLRIGNSNTLFLAHDRRIVFSNALFPSPWHPDLCTRRV